MTIRQARINDRDNLMNLWKLCGISKNEEQTLLDFETKMKYQPDLVFVNEQENQITGAIMGGYDGKRGWLNFLAVHPDFRRRGIATRLVEYTLDKLKLQDCPKVNIQVRNTNREVILFYQSVGFTDDDVFSMGIRLIEKRKSAIDSNRKEYGRCIFNEGYNCAQSTALPFAADLGIGKTQLAKMLGGFGGGMGGQQFTCGAVSGGISVLGLLHAKGIAPTPEEKATLYSKIKEFGKNFSGTFGCQDCRKLLGVDLSDEKEKARFVNKNMKETKCHRFVAFVIDYLEKNLLAE